MATNAVRGRFTFHSSGRASEVDHESWFGAELKTITEELASEKDLKPGRGIYVSDVEKGSPAEKSGLKSGDVLLAMDGNPVVCVYYSHLIMLRKEAGDEVRIAYRRDGKTETAKITLAKLPKPSPHDLALRKLGFDVRTISPETARTLYIDANDGIQVSKVLPRGPAAERGIEIGDVIVQLGEYRVRSLEDIAIILDMIDSGDTITFGFIRGQYMVRTRLTTR